MLNQHSPVHGGRDERKGVKKSKRNGKVTRIIKCSWHHDAAAMTQQRTDHGISIRMVLLLLPDDFETTDTTRHDTAMMAVVQDHKQKTGDREEGSAKPFNFPPLYGNGFSEYHYEFVV